MSNEHLYKHALRGNIKTGNSMRQAKNPLIRSGKRREAVDDSTASRSLTTPKAPEEASRAAVFSSRRSTAKKIAFVSASAAFTSVKKIGAGASRAGSALQGGVTARSSEYTAAAETMETAIKDKAKRVGSSVARKAGQYTAKGAKSAVRTIGKLLASLTRALAKIIGSAAAPVVVIVAVIASIGLLLSSAFGVLFDDGDATTPTMEEIVSENEQGLQDKINEIYTGVHPEPDVVLMDFYALSDGIKTPIPSRLNNMADVMAVWASRTTMADNMDVIELDEQRQFLFQQVFEQMTSVDHNVSTETRTQKVTDADGNEKEVEVTITTLLYSITSKTRQEMYNECSLSEDTVSMAEELSSTPEFQEFAQIAAQSFNPHPYPMTGGVHPGQVVDFTAHKLPPSALANQVVSIASKYLGMSYDELDCSKLTQTVFAELGVTLPRTAAEQARYIINNGKAVLQSDLQVGDLIFYSLKGDNGRYMHVSHVAIYAGDGMIIDASSINGYTIYRDMDTFSDRTTVLYGRP